MKKMIFGAAIALMAGAMTTSCGSDSSKDVNSNDSIVNTETSDSISRAFGRYFGIVIRTEMDSYTQNTGEELDREEFYKGIHSILATEHSNSYKQGQHTAINLMAQLMTLKDMGVQVNNAEILNKLRVELMADSAANDSIAHKAFITYNGFIQRVEAQARAREEAKLKEAPEAVQNRITADAHINKLKKENPAFNVTESGIGYIITTAGEGEKPQGNSDVTVSYTGTHLDGKAFDSNESAQFNLADVVPGFREALTMLGVGGEGTFYIPGKLAYGVYGKPAAGIGPDEMLVFKVKLLSIDKPEDNAAKAVK